MMVKSYNTIMIDRYIIVGKLKSAAAADHLIKLIFLEVQ